MTWDGDRLAFYADAAEQGTRSAGSIHVTDTFAGIGARSEEGFGDDGLALEFTGEIDEVMFFARALDPAEIRAVYETTFGSASSPPVDRRVLPQRPAAQQPALLQELQHPAANNELSSAG